MEEIFLTNAIDNDKNYVDHIVYCIKAVPENANLEMHITCEGGDTFQGARIHRAIMEHVGKTKAVVIGLAASMGATLLSSFDEVEIDEEAELMFHKAHIAASKNKEYTEEQKGLIERFNDRAFRLLSAKGVDGEFLNKVFKSEGTGNYWITAKQAEDLGIGKRIKIERRDSKPFKVAASLDINQIKNKLEEQMGLFKKEVAQVANLEDGRTLVFTSKKSELEKGNLVNLAGSEEKLDGSFKLANKMVAIVEKGVVVNMEEEEVETPSDMSPEEFEELKGQVADLTEAVKEILEKMKGDKEEEGVEAKKEEELKAEYEEKMEDVAKATETATNLLNKALTVAASIKGDYKLETPDDKHEGVQEQEFLKDMSESERHAYEMRNALNEETQEKEK